MAGKTKHYSHKTIRTLFAIALGLLAAACGGETETAGTSGYEVSDFEAELLADGTITLAEYEEAVTEALACIEAVGFEPDPIERSATGRFLTYGWSIDETPDLTEERLADMEFEADACEAEHVDAVANQWILQTSLSEAEQIDAVEEFRTCLVVAGYETEGVAEAGVEQLFDASNTSPEGQSCAIIFDEKTVIPFTQ